MREYIIIDVVIVFFVRCSYHEHVNSIMPRRVFYYMAIGILNF